MLRDRMCRFFRSSLFLIVAAGFYACGTPEMDLNSNGADGDTVPLDEILYEVPATDLIEGSNGPAKAAPDKKSP